MLILNFFFKSTLATTALLCNFIAISSTNESHKSITPKDFIELYNNHKKNSLNIIKNLALKPFSDSFKFRQKKMIMVTNNFKQVIKKDYLENIGTLEEEYQKKLGLIKSNKDSSKNLDDIQKEMNALYSNHKNILEQYEKQFSTILASNEFKDQMAIMSKEDLIDLSNEHTKNATDIVNELHTIKDKKKEILLSKDQKKLIDDYLDEIQELQKQYTNLDLKKEQFSEIYDQYEKNLRARAEKIKILLESLKSQA